jgi:hypothetical protein
MYGISMATEYLVQMAVTLTPKIGTAAPRVRVSIPGNSVTHVLHQTEKIQLEFVASSGWVEINFCNKPELDHNMAVIIDRIEFFGISNPKFVWRGVYFPEYPEPWYSQQIPAPAPTLPACNYLGWNGCWRLDFDVPVFTWMHQVQDLGWIYQ